jgi:DUF971 family protein
VNKKLHLPIVGQPDPGVPLDVHLVGRYALGITWADQHGSIYPFEHLRRACACGSCATLEAPAGAAAWPQAIKKTAGALRVTWADGHESLYPYPDLRAVCRCAGCTSAH